MTGVITELSHLRGIGIVEDETTPKTVTYLPVSDMPSDVGPTFGLLFLKKQAWTEMEIAPYLEDFCSKQMPVTYFLNKFSRSYIKNGVKHYTSKHRA